MPSIWLTTQEFNKQYKDREKRNMIADKRTRMYRQVSNLVIALTCLLLGALLNKWQMTPTWASKQLKLGTDLLSPVSQNYYVFASEKAPEPTPVPTPTVEDEIREVFGKDADDAIKVARCESGLRADAVNKSNSNGSRDGGLFQINSIHGIPDRYLFNSSINIRIAKQMFDANGWNNWRSSNKCHHLLGY